MGSSTKERANWLLRPRNSPVFRERETFFWSLSTACKLISARSLYTGRKLLQPCRIWSGRGDGCVQKCVHHPHCVICIYYPSQAPYAWQSARKPRQASFCHVCGLPDDGLLRLAQSCACYRRDQNWVGTSSPGLLPLASSFILRYFSQRSNGKLCVGLV